MVDEKRIIASGPQTCKGQARPGQLPSGSLRSLRVTRLSCLRTSDVSLQLRPFELAVLLTT